MLEILLPTVLAYLPYAAVAAFTPGPNNILSLHAIAQNGWHEGKKVLYGIAVGFLCVMSICGIFCWGLAQFLPGITTILTYLGAAYILWLAWHIAKSQPDNAAGRQASFLQGMALQFINVKIYMYGLTVFSAYVLPVSQNPLFAAGNALILTLIGASGFLTWGLAGGLLQNFIRKYFRPFNLAMAAILVICAIQILI
ncbi:MAG: LysE family transporter [Firmicutes bacterium]|nr:LysE family transporter [Bacillota bacterium]